MAKITAAQVKELRDATGISMLKCKQSLEEANGDLEKAREILRKLGEADAAKRSEKEAGEGVIAVKAEGGKAVILQLLCETDFVAKGENFTNLAAELAEERSQDSRSNSKKWREYQNRRGGNSGRRKSRELSSFERKNRRPSELQR